MEFYTDIVVDILTSIFIILSFLVGIKLILKHREEKEKAFITVGFTWIFLTASWWLAIFELLVKFFRGTVLSEQETAFYISLFNPFTSIAIICWVYSFCVFVYPKWKKNLVLSYLPVAIIYIITFLVLHLVSADFASLLIITSNIIPLFYAFTALATGYLFFRRTNMSEKLRVRWKGRFLLLAFISFTIGSFLKIILNLTGTPRVVDIIPRLILISCAIEYYLDSLCRTDYLDG